MTKVKSRLHLAYIIVFVSIILFLFGFALIKGKKEINIFEIEGTAETYSFPPTDQVIIEKHYMICGSGTLTHEEIKNVIEDFISSQMDILEAERKSVDEPDYEGIYKLWFY